MREKGQRSLSSPDQVPRPISLAFVDYEEGIREWSEPSSASWRSRRSLPEHPISCGLATGRRHTASCTAAAGPGRSSTAPSTWCPALVVAGHPSWVWPGAVLTGLGWLLVAKAVVCFLAPQLALRSMERGGHSPRGFVAAGVVLLLIGAWACYCLWRGGQNS